MKIRYCDRCTKDIRLDAPTMYRYLDFKTKYFCSNGCLILHIIERCFSHGEKPN